MRFSIEHRTHYVFSRPVFLEPHLIRLTPRQDLGQRNLSFELTITPEPAGQWQGLDQEGNPFVQVWFDAMHDALEIHTHIEAETLRDNPFAFLPTDSAQNVPAHLDSAEARALAPCLTRCREYEAGPDAAAKLGQELLRTCGGGSLDFLLQLNSWLFTNIEKISRREPGIYAPQKVLEIGRGACRDSTVLFMECCRALGIPARFVSGYHAGNTEEPGDAYDLHAWAEAYVPGAGWLGFDPTHGLAVAGSHLALAASHDPALAAPLTGTFRGTDATSSLSHDVRVLISS